MSDLEEVAPGMYIRRNTPRRVKITDEFVERLIEGQSRRFKRIIRWIQRENNARLEEKP